MTIHLHQRVPAPLGSIMNHCDGAKFVLYWRCGDSKAQRAIVTEGTMNRCGQGPGEVEG